MCVSLIPGNASVLIHFNRILALCSGKNVRAECLQGVRTIDEIKRFLQNGPARVLYIIGHSSKEAGLDLNGIGFREFTLAKCFPKNKALLPNLLFLNTCYGEAYHAGEMTKAGIKTVVSTRNYIALDAALRYGEAFIENSLFGAEPRATVDVLNKQFEEIASFQVTPIR